MRRIKAITAITAACIMVLLFSWQNTVAAEQACLHGDTNIPMILNTGGMYNDGNTGIFMDLTSIDVEDLFKNGLALKADFLRLEKGVSTVYTVHFRMTDDGDAWIAREDGWHSVNEESTRAEKEAIRLIREDMGKETRRDNYMNRITSIWDRKVKEAETARQEEYEKLKKTAEEKSKESGETEEIVEMPDLKMPELKMAEPDKVVAEAKAPPQAVQKDELPITGKTVEKLDKAAVNPTIQSATLADKPVEMDTAETAVKNREETMKEESGNKELGDPPITVSPEKTKAELMPVKVKGNVQTEKEAKKNEKGEITEQVEVLIIAHPVVEIISGKTVT